jgi:ribosome-binding factor A
LTPPIRPGDPAGGRAAGDPAGVTSIMASRRIERVNELLKHEIGEIIRRELSITDVGLVSVNAVETSGDLRSAKVFISLLGKPDQQKRALKRIEEKRVLIQGQIGRAVVLKYTPTLTFIMDDTIEKAHRVLQIIDEIERTGSGPAA